MADEFIVIPVDMGEGGPMSEFDRVRQEAEDAIARALAVPPEMLTGTPSFNSACVYEALFKRMSARDWMRTTEVDERGCRRRA